MSNDVECPRCGMEVSEKSIREGDHKCDDSALLDRIRELEDDIRRLETRIEDLELGRVR